MAKSIEVDELKEWVENWFVKNRYYHPYSKTNNIPIPELYDILERMPTIDSEPIRHGHWNERYDTRYHFECSICKYLHQYKDNYCPLCGAKMDEEINENETC